MEFFCIITGFILGASSMGTLMLWVVWKQDQDAVCHPEESYKIEHWVQVATKDYEGHEWRHALWMGKPSRFTSLEAAQHALHNSHQYPDYRPHRIVRVTEGVVFESIVSMERME